MLIPIHKKGMAGKPQSESSVVVSGPDIFIPAGNYKDDVNKSIEIVEQAVPSVEIDGNGLITTEASQIEGYVEQGIKSNTKQLTTQAAKTITPTTSEQTAVSAGVYTTGAIKVAAMPTTTQATPSISIDSAGKITASATQTAGYVAAGIKSGTKQLTVQAAKTVTPTTSEQTAVASGVYTTGAIKVAAMPTVGRADTSISVSADDTNDKLTITASNNQGTGYVTGANKTASKTITLTVSGSTITASDGSTSISKSVATATQATPSISVSSAGLITASATQSAGYVSAGTKSATKQLTTKGATTYTPGTSNQTIASGTYLTGTQTIKGDSNLKASNIKEGVSIFGVTGTVIEKPVGLPSFSYNGTYSVSENNGEKWAIKFLTSGTFVLNEEHAVDVFLVGGGGGGCTGKAGTWEAPTGAGGYTTTQKSIYLMPGSYTITVGSGGSAGYTSAGTGGTSSAFGINANGGGGAQIWSDRTGCGGSGGSGGCAGSGTPGSDGSAGSGGRYWDQTHGSGQGRTTREFSESGGKLYSTGGKWSPTTIHGGNNTGDGGSGGQSFDNTAGGNGGSGIVIIRSAR